MRAPYLLVFGESSSRHYRRAFRLAEAVPGYVRVERDGEPQHQVPLGPATIDPVPISC